MKHYVYRFMMKDEVVYVGETKSLDKRIQSHFCASGSNLTKEHYALVDRVDFIEFDNTVTGKMFEIYYINVEKPLFNGKDKVEDYSPMFAMFDNRLNDWITYAEGNIPQVLGLKFETDKKQIEELIAEFEKTNKRLTFHCCIPFSTILRRLGKDFVEKHIYTYPGRQTKYVTDEGLQIIGNLC